MSKWLKEDYDRDNGNKPTDTIDQSKLFDTLF